MNSFEEIQNKVYEIGAIINAPKRRLHLRSHSSGDGSPCIKVSDGFYEYLVEERGCVVESRRTDDFSLLVYWIMSDVIFQMASDYEIANRDGSSDSRRILFSKEIELFERIDKNWASKKIDEINAILARSPYF